MISQLRLGLKSTRTLELRLDYLRHAKERAAFLDWLRRKRPPAVFEHRRGPLPAQPVEKSSPLLCMAKIVKTQFKRPGRFEPETQLGDHLARRTRGDYSANLILSERPFQEVPLAK